MTVFSARCPAATLTLSPNHTVSGIAGSTWTETPTTVSITFLNPGANVLRVDYNGTRTAATNQVCFTGTAMSDWASLPGTADLNGVWQGCLL